MDVRSALQLAAIFTPLVALLLFALYLYSAGEFLELATYALDEKLTRLEQVWHDADPARRRVELEELGRELASESGGFSVLDPSGRPDAVGGIRPDGSGRASIGGDLLDSIRIGARDRLVAARELASGERIEVFVSSAALVRERDEVFQAFRVTLVVGILLVGAVTAPVSWLSLAPLRRATRAIEAVDVRSLATRLPTRETNDDVDRHVRVVNRLLDQLERGFASLDAFSQDVAHELRTPIHRILNACEALLLDPAHEGQPRSELHTIAQTAEQMSRLVDGLLILARGERDALALRREAVDVASLCGTIAEIYEPACDRAGVRLEVDCKSSMISVDASLFLRALGNLLDNALAHTPSGGAIRILGSIDPDDPGWFRLAVEDDGPGIPDVVRGRIFDRFLRSPSATPGSGIGLGLPIARAIARAHGGDLVLVAAKSSSALRGAALGASRGACFVVSIPRLTA